jgi:hypothetical protein
MSGRTVIQIALFLLAGLVFVLVPERRFSKLAADSNEAPSLDEASLANASGGRVGALVGSTGEGRQWPGIRGRVLDLHGDAVAGLAILHRSREPGTPTGLEAADGGKTAVSSHDGRFDLMVGDPGGELSVLSREWVLLREWRKSAGEWEGWAILLVAPADAFEGDVVDERGRPVALAEIGFTSAYVLPPVLRDVDPENDASFELRVHSDSAGHFKLDLVPALSGAMLHVSAEGYAPRELAAPPVSSTPLRFELIAAK